MTIKSQQYENIIKGLRIGNSVAEFDNLLESARVETPVYKGVLRDDYDFVLGRKGAGKTAIFKLIDTLKPILLEDRSLIILSGVNASGESIFNRFKDSFIKLSEENFETFWKMYFVSLIYNEFIKNPKFDKMLRHCREEIQLFKNECEIAGIPDIPNKQDKSQIIEWIMDRISRINFKVPMVVNSDTPNLFSLSPELEVEFKEKNKTMEVHQSLYVNKIGNALKNILKKSNYKIWIILDRLDEVFDRYSLVEFKGLRGLLRAYKSFDIGAGNDMFRIKIFLRDDIKAFLTDDAIYKKIFRKSNIPPLAAATHIFSKESPTLSWTEDEIQQLILNRLLLLETPLWEFLEIYKKYDDYTNNEIHDQLKKDLRYKDQRMEYWNKIFPIKISSSPSLKWIFTHLKDSNDVVTPRSVIDMLEAATNFQRKHMQTNYSDSQMIFPVEALKEGINIASHSKLEKDIYNEFPRDQKNIKILSKIGKYKLSKSDLQKNYGKNWEEVAESLKRIGILKYVKNSNEYRIEFLFRPALNIVYKY